MVESVNAKTEGSVFSIKKGKIPSGLIPHLKLPHEPFLGNIEDKIAERKRRHKNGACPHFFTFFLRYGDSVDIRKF
jgi:hypothetical protein